MDKLQVIAGWVSVAILLTVALFARKGSLKRMGAVERAKETRRRSGGGGMLVLQEFIEPRVAHVQQVSEERGRESDPSGGGNSPRAVSEFRASLLETLRSTPSDAEGVRRLLEGARRAGLGWEKLYAEVVRETLVDHPYLAPSIPPFSKVSPLSGASETDRGSSSDMTG